MGERIEEAKAAADFEEALLAGRIPLDRSKNTDLRYAEDQEGVDMEYIRWFLQMDSFDIVKGL